MGMPWDNPAPQQPQQPYRPPQPPPQQPYRPAPQQYPQQPYQPPPPPATPQQMQPDVPLVARNPQTGERVAVSIDEDLRTQLVQALVGSVIANKDELAANAEAALRRKVQGKPKPKKKSDDDEDALEAAEEALEEAWTAGPVTARTLIQGLTIDIGVAALAVLTTVLTDDFNYLDVDAWLVVGSMLLKTVISTAISFAVKMKVS